MGNIFYRIKQSLIMAGFSGVLFSFRPVVYAIFERRRDYTEYSSVDNSALVFIAYAVLSFIVAFREIQKNHQKFYSRLFFHSNLVIFEIYSALAFLSIFWTVNVPLTGYRAFECVSQLLIISVVVAKLQLEHGTRQMLAWILSWYVCFDIICHIIKHIPAWDTMLQLSQMTATVFFFLAIFNAPNKFIKYLIAVFSIFSSSTTSYIGMAIGTFSMFWGNKRLKATATLLCVVLICAIASFGTYRVLKNTVFIKRSEIGLEYMNGRDMLWINAFTAAAEKPWTGYGFFAGEPYILYRHYTGAINAHSSFCSALLGLGYPGFVLISLYILSYIPILLGKNSFGQYRAALMGCYAVAVCHCIANPGIGSRVFGSWTSVMTLFVMINAIAISGIITDAENSKNLYQTSPMPSQLI